MKIQRGRERAGNDENTIAAVKQRVGARVAEREREKSETGSPAEKER